MINKQWQVLYKGVLVTRTLTKARAYRIVGQLIVDKGWNAKEFKIEQTCILTQREASHDQ